MRILIGATALALSTTAMAQTAATPPASTTQSTTTTTTAPADAMAPEAAQTTTSTTETTTVAQAAPVPATDPKAALAQQFPTYDKDSNGTLSQIEFASWLGEMKTAQNTEKLTPAQISKWANDSFSQADKDKSKSVTVAELQNFLVPAAA